MSKKCRHSAWQELNYKEEKGSETNTKNSLIKNELSIEQNINLKIEKDEKFLSSTNKNGLYNIILNKIGSKKYEIMRVIKSYTMEDISKISQKLNSLPCIIMENCSEMQAEIVIRELTDLGAEVYKK